MKQGILLLLMGVCGFSFTQRDQPEIRNDFKKYYDQFEVEGSFVLYDPQKDHYVFYNQAQYQQSFTPASTFKICNSLIGLETGVIRDADFVIPWDGTTYWYAAWNQDHDLKNAFKNSTVWYYQELARRVGGERMKYWLDKSNYGNRDTSGGIDRFWLSGGLRISPKEQLDFLRRLHENKLPFSQRSMDIVKQIMIAKDTTTYTLRAKTGWGDEKNRYIGWYVGYVEKNKKVYYFVNCIQTKGLDERFIAQARKEIAYEILRDLKVME